MKELKYIISAFIILFITAAALPFLFPLTDTAAFTGNYRIPYSAGDDYFLYSRYSGYVSTVRGIPVIGDSVIWGHYTDRENTLSANLNSLNKNTHFINMGLDGIHPAAMNGLLKYYSSAFSNRKLIVGINLLWMSSARHDLSGTENSEINHRQLLPQFYPEVPSYKPSFEEKISAVISRSVPFFSWADHLRISRFAGKSFYIWTMENPHSGVTDYFARGDEEFKTPEGISPDKMQEQNIEWIAADKSLQWKFMRETLLSLKRNGNSVAAIITPFNTYMMTQESRNKYFSILKELEWELREDGITPVIPLILEKKYFADSSHPTAQGYKTIAEDIMKNPEFRRFIEN